MNICVPINQRIEDIAKRHNLAPKTVATIVGTWREEDPDGRYNAYPDDGYFNRSVQQDQSTIKQNQNQIQIPKLNQDFSPALSDESTIYNVFGSHLQTRIDMIARDFGSQLNNLRREKIKDIQKTIADNGETEELKEALQILEQNNYEDRKTVLRLVGGARQILNSLRKQYEKYASEGNRILYKYENGEKIPVNQEYIKSEYRKVLDNFQQLYNAAQSDIEKVNGIHTEIIDSIDTVDEDGRDGASGNEGWGVKWHMVNLHDTTSSITRGIISQVRKLKGDGKTIERDDLENPIFMDENEVHKILVDILSEMESSEDFCVYDNEKDEYTSFPLLEKANKKYKWITPIIQYLKSHPDAVDAFYADFRNDYFQYRTIKTVADKLSQKNVSRMININERSAVEGQMDAIQSNISNGFVLNKELSVYNTEGKFVGKENLKNIINAVNRFRTSIKHVSQPQDITEQIVKDTQALLNAIGYPIEKNELKQILKESDNIKETLSGVASQIGQIIENISKNGSPEYRIFNENNGYLRNIVGLIGTINANLVAQNFRQNGNTYTSYTKPNFLSTTRKLLKGNSWKERLDFYRQDKTFVDRRNGNFWFEWMNLFDNDKDVRKQFDLFYVNQIDGIEYNNWTASDIYKAFTEMYFLEQKKGYGSYNSPILADSPVSVFVTMPKYEDDMYSYFEDKMLPLFRRIVRFELARMRRVEDQNKTKSKNVANFNKQGLKFRFFPELNTLTGRDGKTFMETYLDILKNRTNARQKTDQLIDNSIRYILNGIAQNYISSLKENGTYEIIRQDLVDNGVIQPNVTEQTFERKLHEFIWNNTFAEMNMVHLFGIDPAYTKSGTDFQKRWKQIYASGIRPNTAGKYGKKTQNVIYLADDVFRSRRYEDIKLICDQKVERGEITSFDRDCILNIFKQVNNSDAQALRSMKSFEQIMRMVGKWNDMRDSFERLKSGNWNWSDFNKVYQTIKPFTYTLTQESDGMGGTQIVPHHNKNSEFLLLAMFNIINADLNRSERLKGMSRFMEESGIDVMMYESAVKLGASEVISLNYSKDRVNDAIIDGYVEIDGKKFSIDPTSIDESKDRFDEVMKQLYNKVDKGIMSQEDANKAFENFQMNADEVYNELVSATGRKIVDGEYKFNETVHVQNLDDWGIITPTPEHFFDSMSVEGSQERNITPSDLPDDFEITINGKTMDKQQFLDTYYNLYNENYLCDFFGEIDPETGNRSGGFINMILDENGNFDISKLSDKLQKLISESSQYSRQIKEAVQLKPNGKTRLPFSAPQMFPLQQLVMSQAKNKIIRRKVKGASAILVSGIGMTDQLNVVYEYTDNSGKQITLKEAKKLGLDDSKIRLVGVECFMPASQKKIYKNYLKTAYRYVEVNGKTIMEKYTTIDYERLKNDCPEALKALGFRIPTENKYSITPLIIKGFLPEQNGSSIMVAADITALTGCDFDVDKMFLYFYETQFEEYTDNNGKKHSKIQLVRYDPNGDITKMTKAQRNNYLLDLKYSVMTHPSTLSQFQNPGNFEKLKIYSRISFLLQNKELLDEFIKQQKKSNTFEYLFRELFDGNPENTLKILDDFIRKYSPEMNICTLDTFVYNHEQNMAGNNLIGVYAVGGSQHMKYQNANISLIKPVEINGKELSRIDERYTKDGWLVSKQLAEFLAASVDNVKDPVLANMLQNLDTANFAIFMMRLGMNMEEITLVFNNPYLRDLYKHDGSFKNINTVISNLLKNVDNNGKGGNYLFNVFSPKTMTSKMLFDAQEQSWPDTKVNIDTIFANEGYRTTIQSLLFISKLLDYSEPLSDLSRISKFDSPKNAPSTLMEASKNIIQIKRFNKKSDVYGSMYVNLPTIGIMNVYEDGKLKLDVDRARDFARSGSAKINQSAFTFGYDLPLKLVSEYLFTQNSPEIRSLIDEIGLQSWNIDDFYEKLMYYNLVQTELFGDDENNTFAEKYNYYIKEFPALFMKMKRSNNEISKIPIIQMLDLNNGRIVLKRSGRLTQADKDILTRNLDQMMFSGDQTQMQLAYDLFRYSFYSEKLGVDHSSFGNLFSVQFIEQFPEYIETCDYVKERSKNKRWLDRFQILYEYNHIDDFARKINTQKNPYKVGPDGSIILTHPVNRKYIAIPVSEGMFDFGDKEDTVRYYVIDDTVDPDDYGTVFTDVTDYVNMVRRNEIYYFGNMTINEVSDTIGKRLQFEGIIHDNQDDASQGNGYVSDGIKYGQDTPEPISMDYDINVVTKDSDAVVPLYQQDTKDNTDDSEQIFCEGEYDFDY